MSAAPPLLVRQRACALIRSSDGGRVLLVQDRGDDFWTLPGGSVEPGEFAAEALQRELLEELATTALRPDRLFLVCENHFRWRGQAYQEVVMAFGVTGSDPALEARCGPFVGAEPHLIFEWVALPEAVERDLRPASLRRHLLTAERGTIAHECLRE